MLAVVVFSQYILLKFFFVSLIYKWSYNELVFTETRA